jgi:lipoate-protein ligase A
VTEVWRVEQRVAPASELHGSWPTAERDPSVRRVALCRPTAPAVVLGSTQSDAVVDRAAARAAGFEVTRRRSGGGAVLATRDDPAWVDVWVPTGDPLWSPDVGGAFAWVGATWARALARCGLAGASVQGTGPGVCTRWSGLVCFGGVGTGEVSAGGRKVVGLAQRRNRSGAWFHGACVMHWDPAPLLAVLVLSAQERGAAGTDLGAAVAGVADLVDGPGPSRELVGDAFIAALPGDTLPLH